MPSYFSDIFNACPNLPAMLNDAWLTPGQWPGADDRIPLTEFIMSPANRNGVSSLIAPGRGKIRTVEFFYQQRMLEENVKSNQPNPNCEVTDKYGDETQTYTLDISNNIQQQQRIDLTDFTDSCTDNGVLFALQVAKVVDVLERKFATQVATEVAALTGNWGSSVTVNGSNEFVLATALTGGNPAFATWIKLRNALDDSGFPGDVFLSGGTAMREYFQYLQAGCCADYGLDLGEIMSQYGYAYGFDKRLQTALGNANRFLAIAPRALQVVDFSLAEGKAAMGALWNSGSDYLFTTIRAPRTGVLIDLTVKDNCGEMSMAATITAKTIGLPTDMFAVGDEYRGVTYVAKGLVTNP